MPLDFINYTISTFFFLFVNFSIKKSIRIIKNKKLFFEETKILKIEILISNLSNSQTLFSSFFSFYNLLDSLSLSLGLTQAAPFQALFMTNHQGQPLSAPHHSLSSLGGSPLSLSLVQLGQSPSLCIFSSNPQRSSNPRLGCCVQIFFWLVSKTVGFRD